MFHSATTQFQFNSQCFCQPLEKIGKMVAIVHTFSITFGSLFQLVFLRPGASTWAVTTYIKGPVPGAASLGDTTGMVLDVVFYVF